MKNERLDCEIISDLLPLYYDQMTSEETNAIIQSHLANCEGCTRLNNIMKDESEKILIEKKIENKPKKMRKIRMFRKWRVRMLIYGYGILLLIVWLYMVFDMFSFYTWGW